MNDLLFQKYAKKLNADIKNPRVISAYKLAFKYSTIYSNNTEKKTQDELIFDFFKDFICLH